MVPQRVFSSNWKSIDPRLSLSRTASSSSYHITQDHEGCALRPQEFHPKAVTNAGDVHASVLEGIVQLDTWANGLRLVTYFRNHIQIQNCVVVFLISAFVV